MIIFAANSAFAQNSGTCGENATWTYNSQTQTLTISGTGEMDDYSSSSIPWKNIKANIKNVVINEGITSIGEHAFHGCENLTTITIPNSVTSIGSSAFYYCTSLTSVTIPNSVTAIGEGAFACCESLASITIPNNVTSIEGYTFINCISLASVTIPNSVTSIGSSAFYKCISLTSVTIPNNVTSIGEEAFYYCNVLSVIIPNSVTSIGEEAFYHVKRIINYSLLIDDNLWGAYTEEGIVDGDFIYEDDTKTKLIGFIGKGGEVTIPNSVTIIGKYAFSGYKSLTSVTIPNSVTAIEDGAFYGCTSLTSVTIPNSVTTIESCAFYNCTSLENVCLYANPDNLTWEYDYNEFIKDPQKGTNCDVFADYLDKYEEKFNFINATFVGDVKLMSDKDITIAAQTYSGSTLTPVVKDGEKTLIEDEDYTITLPEGGCINAGDYTITITGENPLYYQSAEITFTINAKELVASNVADIAAQVYTGSAIEPEITVSDGEKTLVKGTDYLVTYADNTNVGTAKAIITGIGNYSGIIEKTFTINTSPKTATDDIAINSNIKIWAFENTIFVENASKEIVIVDMSGRIVKTINPVSDRTEVNVSKSGVYIVKTGTKTQKVSL
ncbi:MAG: leucine-rich repeat domain-containing protein [Bacteroidales bacterium]|nr:leucine-rich repeat domain-containing protein [Bacteroidales bacterium]